jgi:hypothetical protein
MRPIRILKHPTNGIIVRFYQREIDLVEPIERRVAGHRKHKLCIHVAHLGKVEDNLLVASLNGLKYRRQRPSGFVSQISFENDAIAFSGNDSSDAGPGFRDCKLLKLLSRRQLCIFSIPATLAARNKGDYG